MAVSVVIRTHASATAGLGHLHRCLALGTALVAGDARVEVWVEGATAVDGATRAGFVTREVSPQTLPERGGADVIVLDGYHYDATFAREACARARLVVTIEDWPARSLPAHLVVNVGAGLAASRAGDAEVLCGPRYALLAAEFGVAPAREWAASIGRVLVTLGSAPDPKHLAALVTTVRAALPSVTVDMVLGPFAAGADLAADPAVRVHHGLDSLVSLMRAADIAVTAAGQTMLQLAATATPTIAIATQENQRQQLATLVAAGAVLDGRAGHACDIVMALASLREASARARLGNAARAAVDGRGAARVTEAVVRRLERTLAIA